MTISLCARITVIIVWLPLEYGVLLKNDRIKIYMIDVTKSRTLKAVCLRFISLFQCFPFSMQIKTSWHYRYGRTVRMFTICQFTRPELLVNTAKTDRPTSQSPLYDASLKEFLGWCCWSCKDIKGHEYKLNIKFFFDRLWVLSVHPARHWDLLSDSVADNSH